MFHKKEQSVYRICRSYLSIVSVVRIRRWWWDTLPTLAVVIENYFDADKDANADTQLPQRIKGVLVLLDALL